MTSDVLEYRKEALRLLHEQGIDVRNPAAYDQYTRAELLELRSRFDAAWNAALPAGDGSYSIRSFIYERQALIVDERLRLLWAREKGLHVSQGRLCIMRLLGKQCAYRESDSHQCRPPAGDHMSLWLQDGKPVAFVSQPYGELEDILVENRPFCKRYGLTVEVNDGASWWNPGSTHLLVYRAVPGRR